MTHTAHTKRPPTPSSLGATDQQAPPLTLGVEVLTSIQALAWQPALLLCYTLSVRSQECTGVAHVCLQILPMIYACPVASTARSQ